MIKSKVFWGEDRHEALDDFLQSKVHEYVDLKVIPAYKTRSFKHNSTVIEGERFILIYK